MRSKRQQQISELVKRELAVTLLRHPEQPFFKQVTVVSCEVSPDLAIAKVYVTAFDETKQHEVLQTLQNSAGFLRKILAHNLNLRVTPRLIFVYDESIRYGQKLSALIDAAVATDAKRHT